MSLTGAGHGRVEQMLQEIAGEDVQVFAVTGIPDERKGERLTVLHTIDTSQISPILNKVAVSSLPNLFAPRQDDFVMVVKFSILGTGKLDIGEAKQISTNELTSMT